MSPLSKITNPEHSNQFKLVKDSSSNRIKNFLTHNKIPTTLHDNLLTFRDTGKIFKSNAHLMKMIANKNYNVDLASLWDKKYCMILPRKKISIQKLKIENPLQKERL